MNPDRLVLWSRLDVQGMDACRFRSGPGGWLLDGAAVFAAEKGVAKLEYQVECSDDWSTRTAAVNGWIGEHSLTLQIERRPSGWRVNGVPAGVFSGLVDVDLGFTPATNTCAIRRLGLHPGREAETTAVWLDPEDWSVKPLRQVYRRISETAYAYSSPVHGYHAELVVDLFGIVLEYPGLWSASRQDNRVNEIKSEGNNAQR